MKNSNSFLRFAGIASLSLMMSCSKNEEATAVSSEEKLVENKDFADCGFVDNNWPSSATLSTTLTAGAGTAADATLLTNQNVAIKNFWRGTSAAAPTFRFVRNGNDYRSTFNAISYGNGRIYYGEGIFKEAKKRDASNLVNVMILAHEYGHQLQFRFGLPSVNERTARAGELEADGMAGYYLRRGFGKSTFADIATGFEFAAAIGDNSVNNPNHHGTAPQRRSAVRLGFLLADPQNTKLTATSFDSNFFFYYQGVLNGTYKLTKPETMSQEGHDLIMSHLDELRKIKTEEISTSEFQNLD